MLLFILSYLGGVLTILSPCILPVIPFVFAKSDQPFRKSGWPLLLGMALTFAFFSGLAIWGGNWAVQANSWGRSLALILLTVFGLSLIFPQVFEKLFEPFSRLGAKLSSGPQESKTFTKSLVLGAATGLLWAPCAGPILGLILTGAATQSSPTGAIWFLLAYALGAASSLTVALVAGGRFLGTLKKSLRAERAVKTGLGIAVLLGVAVIALNLDRTVLTQISKVQTEDWENHLIDFLQPRSSNETPIAMTEKSTALEDSLDEMAISLSGATQWINSPPLSFDSLKGKVVLVDFWTYSCINCLRTLPYVKAWSAKYKDQGLVVIGVHTPEFAFEKDSDNVNKAVKDLGIFYPVAMDNNYAIWNTFENRYWPAHYFIDRRGRIRHHHFGEGGYAESEKVIQELLQEGDSRKMSSPPVQVQAEGVEATAQFQDIRSPETYIGYARAQNLRVSPILKADRDETYRSVKDLALNEWSLEGRWRISEEKAQLTKGSGKILFRFHARDLHLVLGPPKGQATIPFRVTIDGQTPGKNHGMDVDENGLGEVKENRLYQLIRQQSGSEIQDHTFEIEFLKPGVEAFAFTFG